MQYDKLLELVSKRRSTRKFKPDPIPDEYIEKIIDAARWAMSGANAQPWEFVVVKDPGTRKKIVDLATDVQYDKWIVESTRAEEVRHPSYAKPPEGPVSFKDAPVIIVVLGDPRTHMGTISSAYFVRGEGGPDSVFMTNLGDAMHLMHLAVAALDLGSEWLSVNTLWETPLKALLNVPHEFVIPAIIPVGYKIGGDRPGHRRELKELIHYDQYDKSRYRSGDDIYDFLVNIRRGDKRPR